MYMNPMYFTNAANKVTKHDFIFKMPYDTKDK